MMDDYFIFYDAGKNPQQKCIAGVPLRNLTMNEFNALPPHVQAGVINAPFFVMDFIQETATEDEEE